MELTPEEKQAIVNILSQLRYTREEWQMVEMIIAKLSAKQEQTIDKK